MLLDKILGIARVVIELHQKFSTTNPLTLIRLHSFEFAARASKLWKILLFAKTSVKINPTPMRWKNEKKNGNKLQAPRKGTSITIYSIQESRLGKKEKKQARINYELLPWWRLQFIYITYKYMYIHFYVLFSLSALESRARAIKCVHAHALQNSLIREKNPAIGLQTHSVECNTYIYAYKENEYAREREREERARI